jgi:hypothetical protein
MNTRTALTTATLIAATAFPSLAQARPEELMGPAPAPAPAAVASPAPAEPAGGGAGQGFEWGDAGIGAAGAAALMTAGMAGTVARRRRAARAIG